MRAEPVRVVVFLSLALAIVLAATTGCAKKSDKPSDKLGGAFRDAQYLSVTAEYGELVLSPAELDPALNGRECSIGAPSEGCGWFARAMKNGKPWVGWSAYWLPFSDDYLFRDASSPLQKYDRYVKNGRASEYERSHPLLYSPNAPDSSGRCNALALASVLEPEPRPVDGFTLGDMRALVVKTYEKTTGFKVFGSNFGMTGQEKADIYPDQLIRFLQVELYGRHRAFIMDTDLNEEVWNAPMWETQIMLERAPGDAGKLTGTLSVEGAMKLDRNTIESDNRPWGYKRYATTYEFELTGEWKDGSFRVTNSQWIGHAVGQHPDFVVRLPEEGFTHESDNPEIDDDVVARLSAKSRGARPLD